MNDNKQILMDALQFHGHKCWASTAGVRIGLAAMEALGARRSGAKSLHAIVEYGDHHGAMCFGDGMWITPGRNRRKSFALLCAAAAVRW